MQISTLLPLAALSLLGVAPHSLPAVQSSGGQTASTTTWAPGETTAWDYVGSIGQPSGVYLGNYGGEHWVLTAGHVGSGTLLLGGHSYSAIGGSAVAINAVGGSAYEPDLLLFRINPGNAIQQAYLDTLAILELVEAPLAITSQVRLVGHGDGSSSTIIKSWGDNEVSGSANYSIKDTNYGGLGYYTLDANGVRAVVGDSGGGMFYWTGESWALAGILSAAGSLGEMGGGTLAVPLYLYADQILAIVPEPATLATLSALLALASVLVARRRKHV